MRKNRVIEQNRCYHLVSRLAHRAFFLDDEEKDRAVALMRHPSRMFGKVNWYVRNRLYLHFDRKSQRGYVLKLAQNFYSELQAMGLHRLQWRRK